MVKQTRYKATRYKVKAMGGRAKATGCKDLGFKVKAKIRPRPNITDWTPDLTFYRPAMTSSFSVNQLILMEMTLHGEESTNSSDEGVS